MSIVVDLGEKWTPAAAVESLRSPHPHVDLCRLLADAIAAAADKRVVVLDVDEMENDEPDFDTANAILRRENMYSSARVIRRVRDALDALAPPRPPGPTGLGAVVEDDDGWRWVRLAARWITSADAQSLTWSQLSHPVKVLSEGVS